MLLLNVADSWLARGGDRPALGTLYLAGYARSKGLSIDVMDMNHYTDKDLCDYLDNKCPKMVGISMTTPQFREGKRLAELIKTTLPSCKIIAGGAHPTAVGGQMPNIFDYVVLGEAEQTCVDLLQGWCPKDRVIQGLKAPQKSLDEQPLPARDLVNMDKYSLKIMGKKATTIMTSLGCPFHCSFCSEPILSNKFRSRSPNLVVDEMEMLRDRYEIEGLVIYDDVYTINPKRCIEIAQKMEERNVKMQFRATTRANLIKPELLKSLKESGCIELCLGVESGSDAILKTNDKGMTTDINAKAIDAIKNAGIRVLTYMIVGLPGETPETVQSSMDFIDKMDPDECSWYLLAPFPSTPLWKFRNNFDITIYEEEIIQNDWDICQAHKNNEEVIPYIRTAACSRTELKSLWLSAINWWASRKKIGIQT